MSARRFIGAAGAALLLLTCSVSAETFTASWYGKAHHGRKTANGERFDMHAMTAAHKSMPFGTRLRVCRRSCVTVRINDRGPFVHGRSLDLSAAAARAIGLGGVGPVQTTRM